MDSPLNLAHQQGRRADVLVKSGKFEDSLDCHKRAAEYILDAMQQTSSEHALESLKLQHQHHLRQQELIREKQSRVERAQNAQKSLENRTNKACQTDDISFTVGIDDVDGNFFADHFKEASLYHTMTQTDTLLAFLDKRSTSQESDSSKKDAPKVKFAAKEDKELIEELQTRNDDLQKHIKMLLKELDQTKKENGELQIKLRERDNLQNVMSEPAFSPDHFMPFDLPPLEMPELSLDILKEGLESDETYSDDL